MILLSLCIPTYNRARYLEESLSSILNSIESKNYSKVEIVISDNASTDDTQLVIARFRAARPEIYWNVIRQKNNIGPSNVTVVTNYAIAKYVWILSDDDLIAEFSIGKILSTLIDNPNTNDIIVNCVTFNSSTLQVSPSVLSKSKNPTYPYEFLELLGMYLTFISILIFKNQGDVNSAKFYQTEGSLDQCY